MSIGKVPGRPDVPAVDLHSAHTANMLLSHLSDAGARRIALVTARQRRFSSLETEAAYHDFAALHAMQPIVLTLDEARDEALACTEGEALLRRHPEIDAMLVQVDAFAVGLMEAARRIGRRVPHDLQLATRYDSIRAKLSSPPLTTVDLHLAQVATLAVELLLDSQNGAPPELAHPLPSLLPRRSTCRSNTDE